MYRNARGKDSPSRWHLRFSLDARHVRGFPIAIIITRAMHPAELSIGRVTVFLLSADIDRSGWEDKNTVTRPPLDNISGRAGAVDARGIKGAIVTTRVNRLDTCN